MNFDLRVRDFLKDNYFAETRGASEFRILQIFP